MTRRAIELVGLDQTLEISKATAVRTNKNMIHLDQLDDGTWRIIWNGNMIPDFTKLEQLRIIREESLHDQDT